MNGMASKILMSGLMSFLLILVANAITEMNLVGAETGQGTDVFKVIMTVFGVENAKGDVVAIVAVNNGDDARVKFLETDAFKPVSANLSSLVTSSTSNYNVKTMEYVATFPNITVNIGAEYRACILTTGDLELICETGHNSPASRPEFVDISLNSLASPEDASQEE